MEYEAQIRNNLVRKILEMPAKNLQRLSDFVSQLSINESNKSDVLAFSGAWREIDKDVFLELTKNLAKNRHSKRNPIDEKSVD